MPKLIILEGPDCTGKTSLAKFIARRLKAMYFHAVGNKSLHLGMEAYHRNILDCVYDTMLLSELNVVLDRHWPSEVCYGDVLRPGIHHSINYPANEFFARIQQLGGRYIFCSSEKSSERQSNPKVHNAPYKWEDYENIKHSYETLYSTMKADDVAIARYCIEEHGHDLGTFCESLGL